MINSTIDFIRSLYSSSSFIPLHAPTFLGNEKKFLNDTIDSTFVSSVGKYVDDLELMLSNYTGSPAVIATVNGTAALHVSLHTGGVSNGDLVITQPLTFVATCNAITLTGATPLFIDISTSSLGLCPKAVETYLEENAIMSEKFTYEKSTGRRIKAVVPMHTFGHPVELDELTSVCKKWNLLLVEDAAESLGSKYKGSHTGTFGDFGCISFNGNKIITTGGGGVVLVKNIEVGLKVKHKTTTAKAFHKYEYFHDEFGFNYRMPNINAALGCAQLETLDKFLKSKRNLAEKYKCFFKNSPYNFVCEPKHAQSNYWLNAILCEDKKQRDFFLEVTNKAGIMTRPAWYLMNELPMYKDCLKGPLNNAKYFADRLVNIPSSPIIS